MPSTTSLSSLGGAKKPDLVSQFENLLNNVLEDIKSNMKDPSPVAPAGGPPPHDKNDYKLIRELLDMFYNIKLNDTNSLLTYLVDKLTILMTKHDSEKEYDKVIIIDTFYDQASSDLNLQLKNDKFIEIIIRSITKKMFPSVSIKIFTYLYCSLLIIHYYPIVILDTIFSNAKANIKSFKTTIPKLIDNYTTNINIIINDVTSEADSATLAMNAANSAAASADDADADLVQAITHIEAAIARNEAIFTDPKKTDLNLTTAIKTAKDEKINARLISNESSKKSSAATTAATNINAAIISKDPDRIKKAIADAQIPIKEATDSVQDTRKATKKLYTYLIKIEPHASKIRPLSSYFGGSNTSDDTMVGGGSDDTKNILSIINDVLDKTDETGSLIRSSTEIFYKALTILSISIGLPNDFNSDNTIIIIAEIKKLVNKYFTEPLAIPTVPPIGGLAQNLIDSIQPYFNNTSSDYTIFEEIIDNISYKFYSTDDKKLVDDLKKAQVNDTKTQNKLKALDFDEKRAVLAVQKANKAQTTAKAKLDAANKAAADAALAAVDNDTLADAAVALAGDQNRLRDSANAADPKNFGIAANYLATNPPTLTVIVNKLAAAAAAVAPAAPAAAITLHDITTALTAAVTPAAAATALAAVSVNPPPTAAAAAAAAAALAKVEADAAAAAAAAKAAAAKAADKAADEAKFSASATTATASAKHDAAKLEAARTKKELETANSALAAANSALAAAAKKAKKDSKPISITNMKSDIDEQIATHFKEIFAPPVTTPAPKTGGQKTQKNRYRGGIRKNMNSIDSFDSIDSDL
jgi:hypothetical protein